MVWLPYHSAARGLSEAQLSLHQPPGVDVAGVVRLEVSEHRTGNIKIRESEIENSQTQPSLINDQWHRIDHYLYVRSNSKYTQHTFNYVTMLVVQNIYNYRTYM